MAGMKIRFTGKSIFGSYTMKSSKYCILLIILAFTVPLMTFATESPVYSKPPQVGVIKDITASQEKDKLTVTMKTDRLLEPTVFKLDNPPRLVVDFADTVNEVPFTKLPLNTASVKQLRVSQYQSSDPMIARVVFDLGKGFGTHKITADKTSVQITLLPGTQDSGKTPPKPPVKAASSPVKSAASVKDNAPTKAAPSSIKPESVKTASNPPVKTVSTAVKSTAAVKDTAPTKTVPSSDKPESVKTASNPPVKAASPSVKSTAAVKDTAPTKTVPSSDKPESVKTASNPSGKTEDAVVKSAVTTGNVPTDVSSGDSAKQQLKPVDAIAIPENSKETPSLIASLSSLAVPATSPVQAEKQSAKTQVSQDLKASRFTGDLLTLDFVDLPLVDFFRVMSEEGGINIVLDPKVKGNISIKVEKLPWDQIFDMVLVNHSLDKQIEGNLIRIAYKSTLQEEANQREALKKAELLAADLETRVKRLNYAKAEDLMDSLEDLKTVRGTVVEDVRTNSLVLTDIPDSLDKMMDLIKTLDIPQPQVEIEARIVSAARDFAREIGIQFGFVQGNLERVTVGGPNTFGTIGGTRPSATPSSTYAAGNETTGRGASSSTSSNSGAVSAGEVGNYNVNLPASKAFGGLGISIGNIFDTFLLDAALTAGETKGLAKLISQPKVTAQNNSPAVIRQGTRFPVQVVANNTISVQFYDAALILTVVPQITYEGNIVLDLKVENNTADWSRSGVGDPPSIKISESDTRVLVSDGGTTVIGGILVDEESNSGDKVPGLGSLPVIGNLFRRTAVSRNSTEILFFITPRIVK